MERWAKAAPWRCARCDHGSRGQEPSPSGLTVGAVHILSSVEGPASPPSARREGRAIRAVHREPFRGAVQLAGRDAASGVHG